VPANYDARQDEVVRRENGPGRLLTFPDPASPQPLDIEQILGRPAKPFSATRSFGDKSAIGTSP
jgi:hypothetical protein